MAKEFSLELEDYCSYCGEFEADITKIDATQLGDEVDCCQITIRCANARKCARIAENMKRGIDA